MMKIMVALEQTLGARPLGNGQCRFRVWAPRVDTLEVRVLDSSDKGRIIPMSRARNGHYEVVAEDVFPGTRYYYRLDGNSDMDRPDPASRYQPEGVHGPSEVVDPHFDWKDAEWRGVTLDRAIFYEIHVGTFTPAGTFAGAAEDLDRLRDLGVTVVEIMPVAQFPGSRNWGYDGVAPFAVQNSYGGSAGLKQFVQECHSRRLSVAMDVVYNHLGPEGNYLEEFGPYFTEKYRTPWGKALNFDDAWSDEVRLYFIENALMWIDEYHIDVLRLDAVHAIFDQSAYPFLQELAAVVHAKAAALGRHVLVIAESDLNDPKLVRSESVGGWNLDASWSDDLHHSVHALVTAEKQGYYSDFGKVRQIARALRDGYVYQGNVSAHRRRRHGAPAADVPPMRHVVCIQNHDQVGNRMNGERLSALVSFEELKLAAGIVLLSPFTPLLFMGEEYGEDSPFLYFVSHGDPALVKAVREGRAKEFSAFQWQGEPPDPSAEDTFLRSKLVRAKRETQAGKRLEQFYRELIRLRKAHPAITSQTRHEQKVDYDEKNQTIAVQRMMQGREDAVIAMNFSARRQIIRLSMAEDRWSKVLVSADERWGGSGGIVVDDLQLHDGVALQPHSIGALIRTSEAGGA